MFLHIGIAIGHKVLEHVGRLRGVDVGSRVLWTLFTQKEVEQSRPRSDHPGDWIGERHVEDVQLVRVRLNGEARVAVHVGVPHPLGKAKRVRLRRRLCIGGLKVGPHFQLVAVHLEIRSLQVHKACAKSIRTLCVEHPFEAQGVSAPEVLVGDERLGQQVLGNLVEVLWVKIDVHRLATAGLERFAPIVTKKPAKVAEVCHVPIAHAGSVLQSDCSKGVAEKSLSGLCRCDHRHLALGVLAMRRTRMPKLFGALVHQLVCELRGRMGVVKDKMPDANCKHCSAVLIVNVLDANKEHGHVHGLVGRRLHLIPLYRFGRLGSLLLLLLLLTALLRLLQVLEPGDLLVCTRHHALGKGGVHHA